MKDIDPFDSGLLWLINRTTFHPRGYALGLKRSIVDPNAYLFSLTGNGEEAWTFSGDRDDEKFPLAKETLTGNYDE